MILGRDLHANLQILPDVGRQHGLQTLQTVLDAQRPEEIDQPIGRQQMRVHHGPLDVVEVRVVLQGPLQEPSLLAELRDVRAVVVREHVVAENGVGDLGRRHQVHLEQARLQVALGGPVVFEGVEQEGCALLHHVLFHENVDDLVNVGQGLFLGDEHRGETGALIGVRAHHLTQQIDVVGLVIDFFRVDHNFLELARFGKALDYLQGIGGFQEFFFFSGGALRIYGRCYLFYA